MATDLFFSAHKGVQSFRPDFQIVLVYTNFNELLTCALIAQGFINTSLLGLKAEDFNRGN